MVYKVVINGAPTVGKDTFCNYCIDYLICCCGNGYIISSVDFVKEVAKFCSWDGTKTPENRAFLSNLKDLLTEWNDIPYRHMMGMTKEIEGWCEHLDVPVIIFYMIREPEEIKKFVERNPGTITVRIMHPSVEESKQSNHADANIANYNYDLYIIAETLEQLRENARIFVERLMKGEL